MAYCTNPNFSQYTGFTACGHCFGCRLNKKKEWSDRIMVESRYHLYNYFVTLTYAPEFLPYDDSVDPSHSRKYVNRLGYYLGKVPQFFLAAEYGDESDRPHYHLAIFSDKEAFDAILKSWKFGNVDIKPLTPGRCRYIAGYVVKKMTKESDERLNGRRPEFFSASRRPPLGYAFLFDLLEKMATDEEFKKAMLSHPYPPCSVRIGGKNVRLPRYIRDKLKPIYRLYNEELQAAYSKNKKDRDFAILKAIKESVQGVSLDWKDLKLMTIDARKARERNCEKAYKLKQRKVL